MATQKSQEQREVIVVFGDSIVSGFNNPPETCFVALLQKKFPAKQFINCGKVGDTTQAALTRLPDIFSHRPKRVLISFGINDAKMSLPKIENLINKHGMNFLKPVRMKLLKFIGRPRISPEIYKANLIKIITTFKENNCKTILLTTTTVNDTVFPRTNKNLMYYNKLMHEVAAESDIPIIDVFPHFQDNHDLLIDASHPNERGHALIADIISQALKQ